MCGDFNHVIVVLKNKFIPVHKHTNNLHGKKIAIGIIHGIKIVNIYLYLFNLQEMLVGSVVHKTKWSFLFMHNWTTVYLRQRGSKSEVCEYVGMFHESRMWMSMFVYLNILLIRFLKFTVNHNLQLHLSQNKLFWVGPVVHKGVHIAITILMHLQQLLGCDFIFLIKYIHTGCMHINKDAIFY